MARGPICTFCETKLVGDEAFCAGCGHPTDRADHDQRVLWELGQWEVSRTKISDKAAAKKGDVASARTKALADSVRQRAASAPEKPRGADVTDSPHRRSIASRFRRAPQQPASAPAPAAAAKARPTAPPEPPRRRPAEQAPAAARAPVQPAAKAAPPATGGGAQPKPSSGVVSTRKTSPTPQVTPRVTTTAPQVAASPRASATATAQKIAPDAPTAPPVAPQPAPAERPLVTIRRSSDVRTQPRQATAPAATAPAASAAPAPAAPAAKVQTPPPPVEAKPQKAARAPKPAKAPRPPKPAKAPKPPKLEKVKDRKREAEKRERKHRRHSKRVTRRAASLDLKDGERVSLSIEGWSRFRRATLVVTNYRVALITRVPPAVRWIPLEEVSTITRRWQGAWSVVVMAPTEVLTLQKRKGEMLASFKALLDSEVKEARTIGSDRHHADITQDWVDRSTMIWDSRWQRFRLWVRRHPVANVIAFGVCLTGGLYLLAFLTAAFSPVR